MSDFNLPPGVSVNDLPGNRPEDQAIEAFWLLLDRTFVEQYGDKGKKWLEWQEHLEDGDLIWQYVELARDLGWNQGFNEGEMAATNEHENHLLAIINDIKRMMG